MRVHKFTFELPVYTIDTTTPEYSTVDLPIGSQILTGGVDEYSGKPAIWALVDAEEQETYPISVIVAPTGIEVPEEYSYLSTFKTNGGMLVWHLFIRE